MLLLNGWMFALLLPKIVAANLPLLPPKPDTQAFRQVNRERGPSNSPMPRVAQPSSLQALGFADDGSKFSLGRELAIDWAKINSKVVLIGPDANLPLRRSGWEAEDSVRVPLSRSLFVVGRVGADSTSVEWQQFKVSGTTGFGIRLPAGGEVQVRGGRSMTNYDPVDLVLIPERRKTFLELSTRWTLPGRVNIQYTGEAVAANSFTPTELVTQDVRLAIPMAKSGELHFGAKYRWADDPTQAPWLERMKLYFGLQLKR